MHPLWFWNVSHGRLRYHAYTLVQRTSFAGKDHAYGDHGIIMTYPRKAATLTLGSQALDGMRQQNVALNWPEQVAQHACMQLITAAG